MKKTLVITLEFPPTIGGIATYVDNLAKNLESEKMIVLASLLRPGKKEADRSYTIQRSPLLYPMFIWPRWAKLFFIVRHIVKKEKIEQIMVHHVLPAGYVALLMKKFSRIPFTVFFHGTDVFMASRTPWKKNKLRMIVNHAERLVFDSNSLRQRFLQLFPQLESKTAIVYPCVDPAFLENPSPEQIDELRHRYALVGKRVLLSVARLADGKGFFHIIRYLPALLRQVPNLVWVIVGDGPRKSEILAELQKQNLQHVVRFVGEVAHDQLPPYYALADVFVLLTHPNHGREEGFGLVFLEAGALGIPVVAGQGGGVTEAVLHEHTGLVVDSNNEQAVVEAIVRLLKNPEQGKAMGVRAQQRIEEEFQWSEQVKKLLD